MMQPSIYASVNEMVPKLLNACPDFARPTCKTALIV